MPTLRVSRCSPPRTVRIPTTLKPRRFRIRCPPTLLTRTCPTPTAIPAAPQLPQGAGVGPLPAPAGHPLFPDLVVPQRPPGMPHVLPAGWSQAGTVGWHLPHLHTLIEAAEATGAGWVFTVAAAGGLFVMARVRYWHPAQVRNFAAGSLVLPAGSAVAAWSWREPVALFAQGAQVAAHGLPLSGAVGMAVLGVPAAWSVAAWWWARYCVRLRDVGHRNPTRTRAERDRNADAIGATAKRMARYPVPLTTGSRLRPQVVLGTSAATTDHRNRTVAGLLRARQNRWLRVPLRAVDEMMVAVGDTGSGKTTTLKRLVLSLYWTDWGRYLRSRTERPLVVFVDCGGDMATGRCSWR